MANGGGPNWTLLGGVAAMIVAPALLLVVQRAKLTYALDQGQATITAKALASGQRPASHNVTVTGGVVDREHVVQWRLLQNGSERERYYLLPVRPKGFAKNDPVGIIITSSIEPTQTEGDLKGLLRNEGGQGPSDAVKDKLRQQGLKVSNDAVLIELGGSTSSEAFWLAFYVVLAIFIPAMVAGPLWFFQRKMKFEEGQGDRLEALKASPAGGDIKALEDRMFEIARRYFPADTDQSVQIRATTHMGPLQAVVAIDGEDQPAPPDVVALFQEIYATYKKNKSPVKMISYNFMFRESQNAWTMNGGPM
jgi:hypothetical protein